MITRRLNIGEWRLYKRVRLTALKDSPEAFSSSYEDAVKRSDESWIAQADSSALGVNRSTFIAIDGSPLGVAAIYRDDAESEVGELIQMWIAPEKRGTGFPVDLLEALFEWSSVSGFSCIKAEVMITNDRAIKFYKKYGFMESADMAGHSSLSIMLSKSVF